MTTRELLAAKSFLERQLTDAQRDRDGYRNQLTVTLKSLTKCQELLADARSESGVLSSALLEYGKHLYACPARNHEFLYPRVCTCGLNNYFRSDSLEARNKPDADFKAIQYHSHSGEGGILRALCRYVLRYPSAEAITSELDAIRHRLDLVNE